MEIDPETSALNFPHLLSCSDEFYTWQSSRPSEDEPFILHDGPPYANGPLHTGHSINKILKDMIIRVQVQNGRRVLYRPGWDCHGLPIEMKALGTAGTKGLTPVQVRKQARKLATKTVTEQMKGFRSFAVMSEWDNKWTTMDRAFEIRQLRVFQKMVRHGLIYRKNKPVYWSPSSGTALAEAELEYKDDHLSTSAYIRFPITSDYTTISELRNFDGPLYAAIWTTTPWTLPANKAIGVHNDLLYAVLRVNGYGLLVASSRIEAVRELVPGAEVVADAIPGSKLAGLQYRNKLRGKSAPAHPIFHADFVSADSGTGLVHLAPGHGQDDYEICLEHGIEAFAPIDNDGRFTAEAYPDDPEVLTSAPSILDGGSSSVLDLVAEDVIATQEIQHKYPYDWRSKKPVVIRATAQWFADVGSIKDDALSALKNVKFVPDSGRARLESFIKGRSEWCISRQRSWGVPIPALYDRNGEAVMNAETIDHIINVMQERTSDAWFSDNPDDPAWIPSSLQGEFHRGTDTMDVWFDSGTSWAEIEKQVDVYLEGSDQHRGWFQSSLLSYVAAQKADGKPAGSIVAPFRTLITHGFTLDAQGKKMSKSLGNTISPEEVMDGRLLPPAKRKGKNTGQPDALGPDALRLWAGSCDFTTDIPIGPTILQPVHNALVRYRTILKMLLGSLHESSRRAPLTKLDHIALLQLSTTMEQVWEAYNSHEFHKGVGLLNRWLSTDLSAFYLEALKDRLYCGDGGGAIEPIMVGLLRMLAPVTPVLVEEAWANRPSWMVEDDSMVHPAKQLYKSPVIDRKRVTCDEAKLREDIPKLSTVHEAIKAGLEPARLAKEVGSSLQCSVVIMTEDASLLACLAEYQDELDAIFVVSSVSVNSALPEQLAWHYITPIGGGKFHGAVHVLPPVQAKCSRCWRYQAEEEEGLCGRCESEVQKHNEQV
ncbi:isoleucyl-tRNA synthetase, putative [Cordyceps militaris CM01]|uniref:Isoleucine--tRNA ligase, mitochondrial n=1 Tax=Cordyceps militaris (strain CM01) TaxID=983644 RepID=G3JD46_CORMM|nr:isoleucyl-tRNA synthetase, putative [Cordyceps militaris CM01]EGX93372.1 isoleucyl-tRNA synthetase, putative [Cordyceps militaris CM01]